MQFTVVPSEAWNGGPSGDGPLLSNHQTTQAIIVHLVMCIASTNMHMYTGAMEHM